ncbi:MAG: Nif3-like dinuclear metal center hexameric protein [Planctomycetaceae bacterium]
MQLSAVIDVLTAFAPLPLAEEWDNVGLLIGDRSQTVEKILTCLTLTEDVAHEAVDQGVDLIVTHHPVLFRAVKRLTTDTPEGTMLLRLMRAGIAVYSPHTAFDSASGGINFQISKAIGLEEIAPLRPVPETELLESMPSKTVSTPSAGGGRFGRLPAPMSLSQLAEVVQQQLRATMTQFVGNRERQVQRVAVACGAAAEYLKDARAANCDVLVTGEARFHYCLEARTIGVSLILPGHYATERPAVEALAMFLQTEFPDCKVWASRHETDPLQWQTY